MIDHKNLINGLKLQLRDAQNAGDTRGAENYAHRIDLVLAQQKKEESQEQPL